MNSNRKWKSLTHNGPAFPAPYKRLPSNVRLLVKGKPQNLKRDAEEAACMYAKILMAKNNVDTRKKKFNENFVKVSILFDTQIIKAQLLIRLLCLKGL
jgi:hypothetical protein